MAPLVGVARVKLGPFLSTLFPTMGPAVAQLPATSQTTRVPVVAFAVSAPAATPVASEKLASEGLLKPEPLSVTEQAMPTSTACHKPSAPPHVIFGGMVSRTFTLKLASAVLPCVSVAEQLTVLVPRGNIDPEAGAQVTGTAPSTK